MFKPACGRLLWVAVGLSASLAANNALAQSHAEVIQRLQSEGAHLREKLDRLDRNSQTILTLEDQKVHLAYAADMNKGAQIDQEIERLTHENGLLRKEVNAGLAYVVSLAITGTRTIQSVEDVIASEDRRITGTCPESITKPANSGRTVVAPFSPPRHETPTPSTAQIQSGGVGNRTGDAR